MKRLTKLSLACIFTTTSLLPAIAQDQENAKGRKTHIDGQIHNPNCGSCQIVNTDEFVYFQHKLSNRYFICMNTRPVTIVDPTDYAKTEFSADLKKIEIKGLRKPAAIYLAYDLCKGKEASCHAMGNSTDGYLPDEIDISNATEIKIKIGKIGTPYPDMADFYYNNDEYGFVVADSDTIPKTFFINDTNVILLKKKPVRYMEATIPVLYKTTSGSTTFKLRLAFGLSPI